MDDEKLKALATLWLVAKAKEDAANKEKIGLEAEIVALTGAKTEGSQTHNADNLKIVVTGKLTRKMDWAKWNGDVATTIPQQLHPVKLKQELDEKGVRYLEQHEPAIYALLPITVTPAKTAVAVSINSPTA